ncbi:hypothetical protein XH84_31370 [Bradyrhizobium nanningense]|uniref:ATP-binding protein n=1 Tax=Bradyrhizobium nanningense TaxID=1325118 RepID=UPI001008A3BF|nr:ATP-binding protein [Bradyrhizobium nanningense]RXH25496.1 hypothetical protein XH84_31370 [Bradyrhizobium nanningense]
MTAQSDPRLREKIDEVLARAAIIGAFDPHDLLSAAEGGDLSERILDEIVDDVQEVVVEEKLYWKLTARARHETLARAVRRADFDRLLEEAKPHPKERFALYLVELLRGDEEDLLEDQGLSRPDLQDLAVAQDFVHRVRKKPSPSGRADPRWKLARLDDEQRLLHVAPKLVGRTQELGLLTAYATNGEVATSIRLVNVNTDPKKLDWLRPLLLTGIGGSGKSALVAELVRSMRKDDWSGPITVLLDFDRPNLALGAEKEWTAELTRQIGRARTELDGEMDDLRRDALRIAAETGSDLKSADILLERLGDALGRQPVRHDVLIVVDTFEEVIVSSEMGLADAELEREPFGMVLSWIDRLIDLQAEDGSRAFQTVRAVVAGRIQPFVSEPRRLPAWFCGHLELGPFTPIEVGDFLREKDRAKIFDDQRIEQITRSAIEWYPLFLIVLIKFAAEKSTREIDEIVRDVSGSSLYGTVEAMRVLYSRFLDRIKDHKLSKDPNDTRTIPKEDIRKLAHPGLALRTVTAELIRDVLAIPCGLGDIDIERARELLRALSKEAWLVDSYGPNEVRHVTNLRRLMLPMLCGTTRTPDGQPSDLQNRVRLVQERAADWYDERDGIRDTDMATGSDPIAMAAYYRAFYGDVSAIAEDEGLARRVLHIGREDIHAMPPVARALLLKDERSLTEEERAALPEAQRRDVETRNLRKRSKSGAIRASSPPGLSAVTGTGSGDAGLASPRSIRPHTTLDDILEDSDLATRVDVAFKSADFMEVIRLAAPSMEVLSRQMIGGLPSSMFQRLTVHWTWKWACAQLAVGGGKALVDRWLLHDLDSRPGWIDYMPLVAIGRVAAGDASFSQSIRHRPWFKSQDGLDLDGIRMIALALAAPETDLALPMSLGQIFSDQSWMSAEGSGPLILPEEARTQMLVLQTSEKHRYLSLSEFYNSNLTIHLRDRSRRLDVVRNFVRGRTPELYDPVRAALIDIVRYDPDPLGEQIEFFAGRCRIWPVDLLPERLLNELQKTRQADFLLLRLIEYVDVCGLLNDFVGQLSSVNLERVRATAELVAKYDSLLLKGISTEA